MFYSEDYGTTESDVAYCEKSLRPSEGARSRTKASHVPKHRNRNTNGHNAILTMSRAERSGFWFPVLARDFPLLHNVQTDNGVHVASYSMGIGFIPGSRAPELKIN
jgi:hypothetical protein